MDARRCACLGTFEAHAARRFYKIVFSASVNLLQPDANRAKGDDYEQISRGFPPG
jgi:hypothetical protein